MDNHPLSNLQIYTIDRTNNEAILIDRFTGEVTKLSLAPETYTLLQYLTVYNHNEELST